MDPRDLPWAEHEKVCLLAEILKVAPISSQVLLNLIRDHNLQARWSEVLLPQGRCLRACQTAYHDMGATHSATDYRRPQLPTPLIYPGPEISRKRPHHPEPGPPTGRLLQPRPPHAYPGEFIQAGGPAYNNPAIAQSGEPANKKKRGRPTKAEAQQRAQEAAARGEVYPPPRRGRGSITAPPEPSPSSADAPPLARTPPQSVHTQSGTTMTPQHQIWTESGPETSSGKGRRTRPQPLELEKPQRALSEMQSPLGFGSGDPNRNQTYSSFTPVSAPLLSSSDSRDRDSRIEGVEEVQPRTTTPHSFKDTVGI
ncbi:hypothetical protein P153DRAFT_28871 [Dothidotthia symphoricarpi CBS 119687]|uniref:Uncharacterized protein n=1 Tax=Dothidotthia symphoricarpi CBS 119687 TaxID=1392245 RepID=A0A6A6AAJ7_9PLEO|nr:uncharacterized protein P153DRAFT_28871 [Dothidotthia symphoricarpi CBS 119687]KAF2128942.1 hypothetical protein P153DRAFT_28871 [Dothidotthia symphoricarpi CBS 119687]